MALSVRATLGWFGQVIAWLVILGVVVVLAIAVLVPRIAGATPYTVLTGSMQPKYPPGTLVVVKPVEFDEISVGQVITYQLESGKATVVTHRVVGVVNRFDGTTTLVTQGDANQDPDPVPVEEVQVRGKLWYSVPYLGHANSALNGSQRQWAVLGVSALLIGYAAFMFVGAIRDRRRRKVSPDPEIETGIDILEGETFDEVVTVPMATSAPEQDHRRREAAVGGAALLLAVLVLVAIRAHRKHKQENGSSSS
ncbi:MAG: signal peptidase I [Propionibacteriales bacterium]|nr:signal peptidase I [Propionibacteriales bacterium]